MAFRLKQGLESDPRAIFTTGSNSDVLFLFIFYILSIKSHYSSHALTIARACPTPLRQIEFPDYDLITRKEPRASRGSTGINPINQTSDGRQNLSRSHHRLPFPLLHADPCRRSAALQLRGKADCQADVTAVQSALPFLKPGILDV